MNSIFPVIGIFGQKNVGKSTVAKILKEAFQRPNGHFTNKEQVEYTLTTASITGFAYPIKRLVANLFAVTLAFIEEWKNKDAIPPNFTCTMRSTLQQVGHLFRTIQPEIWIRQCLMAARSNGIIIEDGRYLNEFDSIKSVGGFCIVITKPLCTAFSEDFHPSEMGTGEIIDKRLYHGVDLAGIIQLNNAGTLEDLRQDIIKCVAPKITQFFNDRVKHAR